MKLVYCPFCLSAVQGETCPYCGKHISYTGDPMHLQVGYVLNGRHPYVLGASLGQGGFGITYIALDIVSNQRVAIKEYFPTYCAGRNGDVTIAAYRGQEENFFKGKERFLDEARMLKNLADLSGVVDVLEFFEANNSAYFVMEYLEGSSLKDWVEQKGRLSAPQFLQQLKPLMADMEKMHSRGVVHRDIAPDNIIMLPDGQLKLIDFGAARSYLGDKSMTVVVKKGFAPVEQYMRKGSNASTDIYALAATIYYCITGVVPPDSAERQYGEATLQAPSVLNSDVLPHQEWALERALHVQPKDRTQSVAEFLTDLENAERMYALQVAFESDGYSEEPQTQEEKKALSEKHRKTISKVPDREPFSEGKNGKCDTEKKRRWIIPAAAAMLVLITISAVLIFQIGGVTEEVFSNLKLSGTVTIPTETTTPVDPASPPKLPAADPDPKEDETPMEPLLTGRVIEEISFTTKAEGDMFTLSGEFLDVSVQDDKKVTITVSGLQMKDTYIVNTTSEETGIASYHWGVELADGKNSYRVETDSRMEDSEQKGALAPNNLNHEIIRRVTETQYDQIRGVDIEMTYSADSITWNYTMNSQMPFDFQNIEKVSVIVGDASLDLNMWRIYTQSTDGNSFYKRDAEHAEEVSATEPNQETNTQVQTSDPDKQPLSEKELTYTSNNITPIRIQDSGNYLHSAEILDKPINNCCSLSVEITVEEGDPEGFILYVQDLERWRMAGQIKGNGEKVITDTIVFSNPISFNAFSFVPAKGNYKSVFNYKLTGAEIKGAKLESERNGADVVFTGENLTIQVKDDRELSVTVSGLSLLDEYPSKVAGRQGTKEYQWNVYLTSGKHFISFQTDCPVPVTKFNQPKVTLWKEMKHSFVLGNLEFGELDNHFIKQAKPTVTHTQDSITWSFTLDKNHSVDFSGGITAEMSWFDRANNKSADIFYYGR